VRKVALVAMCLILGFAAGLLLRPDDGTQVSISPAESGAVVSGANHAKPVPRIPTPSVDLVRDLIALSAVVLLALLIAPGVSTVLRPVAVGRPPALMLARVGARRGPPARA
jgi:hypothetical protein